MRFKRFLVRIECQNELVANIGDFQNSSGVTFLRRILRFVISFYRTSQTCSFTMHFDEE